jgi:hypothetical protein
MVFNFNHAYHKLSAFEVMIKFRLIKPSPCHADETGINTNRKRI